MERMGSLSCICVTPLEKKKKKTTGMLCEFYVSLSNFWKLSLDFDGKRVFVCLTIDDPLDPPNA